MKRLRRSKILNGPDVLRWMKGGTPEAAIPAKLKLFAPLKPDLLVRAGAGWVAACWSLPTKRQVICRVGYPIFLPDDKSNHVASLAAQWRVGEPPMAKRLQTRIFGQEPVAALLDAEGLALAADIISLPGARQRLQRVAAKHRREIGAGYARLVGVASRLVDTDSQLFRTCYWTIEPKGVSLRVTQGWPLTKRGLEVFTPIVKLARGYNLLESQHWKHRFWRPLRQRLDTLYPLQGDYLLPQKEFRRVLFHFQHLITLMPLISLARIWPDFGRSKGPIIGHDGYAEIMKQDGPESLRVDIQDGDLLWITRRSIRPPPRPNTPSPQRKP